MGAKNWNDLVFVRPGAGMSLLIGEAGSTRQAPSLGEAGHGSIDILEPEFKGENLPINFDDSKSR